MNKALDKIPFFETDPNSPTYEATMNTVIPIINKTPRELLSLLVEIDNAVDRVQRALLDPQNDVQKLVGFIMERRGLNFDPDSDLFNIRMEGNVLRVHFKLAEDINQNIPFNFDLATFKSLVGGVSELDGLDDLIAIGASGNINVRAFASVQIEAGVDLGPRTQGAPVDIFLYDWDAGLGLGTRVEAGFKLLARDIHLEFEVFDSIGLMTNDAGIDFDRDGIGGPDGVLYTAEATIDADGNTTTNPELADENDHSDFVTVAFVLDQAGGIVPDDGLYRFNETLIGDNVQCAGVDGGLEVFLPLKIDVFGTEISLSTPLRIRTNPVYSATPVGSTTVNTGLEQIFRHIFDISPGLEDPVIFDTPDIASALGELANSVIRTLLEDLAGLITGLKSDLLATGFFDQEILGTGRNINSFFNQTPGDDGLPAVTEATGIEAFLNIDTYIFAYLETITWYSSNPLVDSVANGEITPDEIWTGLGTFLTAHYVPTLPGISGGAGGSFVNVVISGSNLSLTFDGSYSFNDTLTLDVTEDLGGVGLEFDTDLDLDVSLTTGLSFDFSIALLSGATEFNFDEFSFRRSLNTPPFNLGLSYDGIPPISLDTDSSGELQLYVGGSVSFTGGNFTFNHTVDQALVPFQNRIRVHLPLHLAVGGTGRPLWSMTFEDTDFYDSGLDPGFSADLREVGGVLNDLAFAVLDLLGEEITNVKDEVIMQYDTEGNVISEGNAFVNSTIPGTDATLVQMLGLDNLLSLGQYVRHYLRPHLGMTGFVRDPAIPLGNEGGDNYYSSGGPTIGGLFQYLEEKWLPTLGGEGGGLNWAPVYNLAGTEIVGVNMSFGGILDFHRTLGINLGAEVEEAGLGVHGDADFDLDLSLDLLMNMSFHWGTDAFSFEIDHLTFQGHALIEDLVLGASFGPLEVAIGQAGEGKSRGGG